ncbi:hypothetical protein FEM48_Zijuj07G0160600 [Ziziphus jujuba var. spinosa]|uniref:Uncharacterized protein n=1 Tax=Ziziphus jujuba var. spinosa TaxID=714518 RepID=A0A978V5L1_ZIZJJ|nr:hypothetical protein FEM48_Zijuj07G0160600 [Ziziphus jujuba var. spinosa]
MLQAIYFGPNRFHGNIPQGIGKLTNMEILYLVYNNLSGTIPSSVFNISSLRYVALTSNGIFGSIPTDMCHRLPNLEAFYLPDNPIRGHIRASLCLCRNLKQLGLGEISSELGKLSNLRMLNLQYNKLSGRLPPTICNLNSSIETIFVSKNLLRGHISDLCLCKKLREVVLDHNGFAGSIPRCLSNLSHLELLDLKNNNLSGEISSELGQLSNLTVLDLQSNNLSGSLPPTIFNHSLTVNVPKITGFQLPMLREVYSSLNRLSGRIPDSISNASMLKSLELATNFFSGPCRRLQALGIGYNPLNGALPESIGNLSTSLEVFSSAGVKFKVAFSIKLVT